MSPCHPVVLGRLALRQVAQGTVVLGCVHLPAGVAVQEGAAYLLDLRGDAAHFIDRALDTAVPAEFADGGASDLARAPVWYRVPAAGVLCVRLIEAFPEENIWTLVGVSADPALLSDGGPVPAHRWFDLADGRRAPIAAPIDAQGDAIGQLLTNYALWPGPAGEPYALPQVMSATRTRLHQAHQLLAAVGAGTMTPADARAALRAAQLHGLGVGVDDTDYCRYLAALQAAGAMTLDAPRTAAEQAAREALSGRLVNDLLRIAA